MLWLALHLPNLALEVFPPRPDAEPFVVCSQGSRPEVLAADRRARAAGIAPEMTVAAARALTPRLAVQPRSPHRETEALEGIAAWALQFTPAVSLAPPAAVLVEIGGCLRLFGGMERLLGLIREGLAEMGFDGVQAAAPTPAGALTLARAGLEIQAQDLAALRRHLCALPLDCLSYPQQPLLELSAMGIRTVGECLALPRDGLARRFGQALLDTLDRALGRLPDPRLPFALPENFASRLALASPVREVEPLLFGLRRQLAGLCGWLAARNAGVRCLTLTLEHEDHPPTLLDLVLAAPNRDPAHLLVLLRERLDRLSLPSDVESLVLRAEETAQLIPRNFSLFGDRSRVREDCLQLVEHLQARLGMEAVSGLALCPEHRPELAWRETEPGAGTPSAAFPPRPLWLLARPRPLLTRERVPWIDGPLTLATGPERIESGWWDGGEVGRDYFVAQGESGARLWVFRERGGQDRWFVHGVFA
jgi:protein ImuB